jgi:hypothetical protein
VHGSRCWVLDCRIGVSSTEGEQEGEQGLARGVPPLSQTSRADLIRFAHCANVLSLAQLHVRLGLLVPSTRSAFLADRSIPSRSWLRRSCDRGVSDPGARACNGPAPVRRVAHAMAVSVPCRLSDCP